MMELVLLTKSGHMCRTGSRRCLKQPPQQKCQISKLSHHSQALTTCLLWILQTPLTQWLLYQGHPWTSPLPLCTACLCHRGLTLVVPCPLCPWDKTCRVLATSSPRCSSCRLPCLLSRRSVRQLLLPSEPLLHFADSIVISRLPVQHHSVLGHSLGMGERARFVCESVCRCLVVETPDITALL